MRVGEILHRNGLVSAEDLATALADQRIAGKRLCSLLVVRGLIDPDQAARVLAEQFGVSAALMRHLEHRDKSLAKLLAANIARKHFALPIGTLRDGEIVICVRDPKPGMQAAFERILSKPVLITVAAAHTLEPLIDLTYPPPPQPAPVATPEFGVRFARPSTNPATVAPQPPPPQTFATGTVNSASTTPPPMRAVTPPPMQAVTPPESDEYEVQLQVEVDLDADTEPPEDAPPMTFQLADLDDAGVDKSYVSFDTKTPTTLPPGFGVQTRAPTLPPANRTSEKKP